MSGYWIPYKTDEIEKEQGFDISEDVSRIGYDDSIYDFKQSCSLLARRNANYCTAPSRSFILPTHPCLRYSHYVLPLSSPSAYLVLLCPSSSPCRHATYLRLHSFSREHDHVFPIIRHTLQAVIEHRRYNLRIRDRGSRVIPTLTTTYCYQLLLYWRVIHTFALTCQTTNNIYHHHDWSSLPSNAQWAVGS